ncbi:neuferricin [Tiliqua scincoides]|uniref:neuferricin n=1 Tax=Tiliqua scincoides TaxID=71010 RepID=UPI003461D40D
MLRGALAALAAGWAAAWLLPRLWPTRDAERVLSAAELGRRTGEEGGAGLCLAVLGQVFDVRAGRRHYGPGGAYSGLAGKDASRAFATGDFSQTGLVDDISGLSPAEVLTIHNWLSFYSKNYVLVGKVAGRFYDENGVPTEALREAQALIEEGQRLQAQEDEKKKLFPPCNSEWKAAEGGRVWCSKESGGVSRDWSGVPRKLYEPGSQHSRCVCVRTEGPPSRQLQSSPKDDRGDLDNPSLQEYEGCHPLADWCAIKD